MLGSECRHRRLILWQSSSKCWPTTTPELGAITAVVMVGAVFSTSTLAEDVAVDPLESVAVAVQVMVEPTLISTAVAVYVLPVSTVVDPTVQS